MTRKCNGCGSILQTTDKIEEGYVNEKVYETAEYCERCFKIMHYGETSVLDKKVDMISLLDKIKKEGIPVIYLLDLTTISTNLLEPLKDIKNKVYLILTKRDLLPKSVRDKKLIQYIKTKLPNIENIMVVSSEKMWCIDELYNRLVKDKVRRAYVIGHTNSGKSTLINSLLKSRNRKATITTSPIPNTTTELINIKLDDLTIIDTPGFINEKSIVNYIDIKEYKRMIPKKEIKPKIYNIKPGFMIIIENILRIENNSEETVGLVFYLKNDLNYRKMKVTTSEDLKILNKSLIKVSNDEDIVIEGLGFIKFIKKADLTVYTVDKNVISIRNKMI